MQMISTSSCSMSDRGRVLPRIFQRAYVAKKPPRFPEAAFFTSMQTGGLAKHFWPDSVRADLSADMSSTRGSRIGGQLKFACRKVNVHKQSGQVASLAKLRSE